MSLEKLVRNMIFIYPLVWWKLGCISLLNIPWFMSWLYLSPTLIVRFLQDKTKQSVTLECKIWHLQDFFFKSINSLTILCCQSYYKRKHQKTYLSANLFFAMKFIMLTWWAHISHLISRLHLLFSQFTHKAQTYSAAFMSPLFMSLICSASFFLSWKT